MREASFLFTVDFVSFKVGAGCTCCRSGFVGSSGFGRSGLGFRFFFFVFFRFGFGFGFRNVRCFSYFGINYRGEEGFKVFCRLEEGETKRSSYRRFGIKVVFFYSF